MSRPNSEQLRRVRNEVNAPRNLVLGLICGAVIGPILVKIFWGPLYSFDPALDRAWSVACFGGAVVGAVIGIGLGFRSFSDRARKIMRWSIAGLVFGLFAGVGFGTLLCGQPGTPSFNIFAIQAGVQIGSVSGAVLGAIIGRFRAGGRIRLWEIMVGVALLALVCLVITPWIRQH